MGKRSVMDTTKGPILMPLIGFSVPIMLANILQLLFNAADIIVVGQFVGETAVAAVGSTGSIINILVSLFSGLSVGATVVIATQLGSGKKDIRNIVQTTYTLGILLGLLTAFVGFSFSRFFLELLNTPADVIDQSETYLKIYFLGQPGFMIYTFARAILVAKGDTRSPFLYLLFAGVINVVLNVILVTVFDFGVAGVAIATITAQYISAVLTLGKLLKTPGMFHVIWKKLYIDRAEFKQILALGLPSGIQSTLLSVSGLLSQSAFNSLGTVVVAGQSASNNIMTFVAQALNAFSQGSMTFASQNYGANKIHRVRKVLRCTMMIDVVLGGILGAGVIFFGATLLNIYTPGSPDSVQAGMVGLKAVMSFVVFYGLQDASGFVLRGMNHSVFPMVTAMVGHCVFRIFWVLVIFNHFAPAMELYSAYRLLISATPISWGIIFVANIIAYGLIMRKYKKQVESEPTGDFI